MDLANYAKYGLSICTSSNNGLEYYMVTLTFGKRWKVQMPVEHYEQKVMCAKVREDGTYCYMSEISNGLQPIFDLIDETIRYNEELEKKVELLKVKAEELKEIFATRSYDELVTLKFTIETPQETSAPKTKRQPNSKKKTPQKPNTELTETKLRAQPEPEGEPVESTIAGQLKQQTVNYGNVPETEPSEIDRKIAEAMKNN